MQVIDAKIRVNLKGPRQAHLWDGKEFNKGGYPVALCGSKLHPRNTSYFMTTQEAATIGFCNVCISKRSGKVNP